MTLRLEEIPLETEDGLNLDHPVVVLFRKIMLERTAQAEKSELYCPTCKTHLPYNHMTVAPVSDGVDAKFNPVYRTTYFDKD